MKRLAIIALACFLMASTAMATQVERESDRERAAALPLINNRADVMTEYSVLSTLDLASRKEYYRTLSTDMKSDLWTVHLHLFLARHHELSQPQRAVIHYAMGLISEGLLTDQSLKATEGADLINQISSVFTPQMAKLIFGELGEHDTVALGMHLTPAPNLADCECSVESNWCDLPTSPIVCSGNVRCMPIQSGCGTFWQYACDGMCM